MFRGSGLYGADRGQNVAAPKRASDEPALLALLGPCQHRLIGEKLLGALVNPARVALDGEQFALRVTPDLSAGRAAEASRS